MMVNIVLYDDESVVRIAQRAAKRFSNYKGFRTTKDTIWLKGMYLKFAPRMLILNIFNENALSEDIITGCMKDVLLGEEVYISDDYSYQKYIDRVKSSTNLESVFCGDHL